ncbi:MAG: MobP3 family relaxase [Oscillospiraceae bacterium]|nr:MobP3 family relaxase [Oscillospiraceae bacterium]
MSKLIQKAGFLNPNRAGRYMNYIATRDGVELLDENADSIYMRYIDTRPRAERHGEHGLFGAEDAVDLEKTLGELKAHEGNVWTIIYSLRREDAARLGYDNAASWRALLRSKQADFAEAMQIPPSQLRWYAAFHDEGDHQHIHMMLWSDDPKYGFLRKDKLLHLQSVLTNMIYADELKEVYVQKDIAYKDVTEAARAAMRRIVDQLETVENPPESIRQKLMELALELHTVNGKKQYGYLKKPLKDKVDGVVDELEKLPEVAAYYSVWNGLRDTLEGYYKNRPRQHNPLSQQKEFRAIKNAIIQEAERLRCQLEESSAQTSANLLLTDEHISSITSQFARLPSEYLLNSSVRLFHQMVQIFRENAAPPSNPMGIRMDSKRRKKLMQKRLAMGHKQDDHEQAQGYEQSL